MLNKILIAVIGLIGVITLYALGYFPVIKEFISRLFLKNNYLSLKAKDWDFQYSPGMPTHPTAMISKAWLFIFPEQTKGEVHYLTVPYKQNRLPKSVTMVFDISTPQPTTYHSVESGPLPPSFYLYFQRKYDNWSAAGKYGSYRWWTEGYILGSADNTNITLTVPFEPSKWSNVHGIYGDKVLNEFQDALLNVGRVGITFGGGYSYGHGVNTTSGLAIMHLSSMTINM